MRIAVRRPIVRTLASIALVLGVCLPARADPPRRILSFNLCADQLVLALADPDQIVGPLALRGRPDAFRSSPRRRARSAGPDGRRKSIVPLDPDLVLVGPWDRPLTQQMLRELGFRVVPVALVNDIEGGIAQIREVAALLGHPERGEAMVAEVDAARARACRGATSGRPRRRC